MSTRISVVITSYNQKNYLIEAIESVLCQTLKPFEIIIIDDASSDGSKELIKSYKIKYPDIIKPYFNSINIGIPKTKNIGFQKVQGDLVTLLDGDDRFLPQKLEKELIIFKKNPNVKLVFSNIYYIDVYGNIQGIWIKSKNLLQIPEYIFPEVFSLKEPYWLFRNELVEYQSLKKIGFYDPELFIYEDTDLRIRLTKYYRVAFCPEPLAEYRQHSEGVHLASAFIHHRLLKRIYNKNKWMLEDLSNQDRSFVIKNLRKKFSRTAQGAMDEALINNNKDIALKYLMESLRYDIKGFNLRLTAQVFIPKKVYGLLKKIYKKFSTISPKLKNY